MRYYQQLFLSGCLLLAGLLFHNNGYSQCNMTIEPAKDCSFLLLLDSNILEDGFCSRLPVSNALDELIPFCNGSSTSDNTGMFIIEPITENLELRITPMDCSSISIPGQGSFSGLQAAIFKDCNFDEAIACAPTCHNNAFTIGGDNFVPLTSYLLVFDGCSGSVCDFKIEVIAGELSTLVPLVDPVLMSPVDVCSNEEVLIQVEGLPLQTTGDWTIDGGTDFEILFNGKAIEVTDWGTAGTKEICAKISDPQSSEIYFDSCWTVAVSSAPKILSTFPDSTVCDEEKIELSFAGENYDDILWSGEGLSCVNCPAPVFTMSTDTTSVILTIKNDEGCEDNQTIRFFPSNDPLCLTNTQETTPELPIQIGPNPFSDKLLLQANEKVSLSIFDVTGKLVVAISARDQLELSTDAWGSGVYFVKMKIEEATWTYKLLKL